MAQIRKEFVNGSFGQIHLRKAAPDVPVKRPLICLHMFPQSGRNFHQFLQHASEERLVIAPDFPGYGESDAPENPITAERYAATLWQVVDALNLLDDWDGVDVFGVHAGAKLCVAATCQNPERVNRLVLSSAAVLYPEEIEALQNSFQPIPLDEEGQQFQQLWKLLMAARPPAMSLETCAQAFAEMLRAGEKREWGHDSVFAYNLEFPDALKKIDHPVALLNPHDELYEMTKRTLDYLTHVTLYDLPQWGHGFLDTHTEDVSKLVLSWLDKEEV